MKTLLLAILTVWCLVGDAFLPTLSFWKRSVYPVFATIDSSAMLPQISNDLSTRQLSVAGPGVIAYKAVVINSGTCNSAGVDANLLAATEYSVATPVSLVIPGGTTDQFFTVCVIGKNFVGAWQNEKFPTASLTLRINTIEPVVNSLSLAVGATSTDKNVVTVALSATHAQIKISHFCLKSQIGSATPVQPLISDSCWKALDGVNPAGVNPSQSISFSGFNFNIGYTQETYNVYGWARSEAGTISSLSNSGNGTSNTDLDSISYFPPSGPTIINVLAANTNSPSTPPSTSELYVPAGQSVFIKWKATDDTGLPSNAINISFTANEVDFTNIATGLPNSQGAGCTIDANYTGCYRWTNGSPFNTYFKVRVGVTDSSGLTSFASAPPNNTTPFQIIAGNTDLGLNGSAAAAILRTRNSTSTNSGVGRFVVTSNGNVFILDDRGLLRIDPFDGLLKMFLPITGTAADGNVNSATLISPVKMTLDASDNLIILDYNRIRKIDLTTLQVSTLVGNGTLKANGTLGNQFLIDPISSNYEYVLFTVLPNGNIWFQSGEDYLRSRDTGAKVRYYNASDQRVYSIIPSGSGSLEDSGFDPSTYSIHNFGITFNPVNSQVLKIRSRSIIPTSGGHIPRSVSYNPVHGGVEAPHIPYVNYWTEDSTVTAMNGVMYNVDHFQQNGVHRYNQATNSWQRILGTGTKGQCPDGTDALACNVDTNDVYVSATGQVYFMDRNRIRVIDSANKVQTLFGQSLAFGDGVKATSARFSAINWIDRANDGRIIISDENEFRIREFSIGGNMSLLAGTGTDAAPDTTNPAVNQPVSVRYWGGSYPFVVDPVTADVIFTRGGGNISRLVRATGLWSDLVGGGGSDYKSADGQVGSAIGFGGYPMGPQGYGGGKIMRHFYEWNGTQPFNSVIKLYTDTNGTQSHFAGLLGLNIGSINDCASGSPLANCRVLPNNNSMTKAHYDTANARWLIHENGSSLIRTAVEGGVIGNLVNLPRGINSFYYIVKSGNPFVYYCSGGRMFKYALPSGPETTLFWPTPTISCGGLSMTYDPTRQSIIFPIYQNGIAGVAEILDP